MLQRFRSCSLLLGVSVLTVACLTKPVRVYEEESFARDTPFEYYSSRAPEGACEIGKRALLSQGYQVDDSKPLAIKGEKYFKPVSDQANKLTTAMNSLSVINEFNVDPSLAGATDWVFSMPTRRYHVAMDYDHAGRGLTGFDGRVFTSTTVATGADTGSATPNVFNTHFNATNTALDTDKIKICVNSAGITMFDREETTKTSGFVISPGTVSTVRFCGETSVLSFNLDGSTADPSVLGSKETLQIIGTPYTAGWAALATAGNGSPVIGSAYMRLTNAGARAGVSGNYGLVYPHR